MHVRAFGSRHERGQLAGVEIDGDHGVQLAVRGEDRLDARDAGVLRGEERIGRRPCPSPLLECDGVVGPLARIVFRLLVTFQVESLGTVPVVMRSPASRTDAALLKMHRAITGKVDTLEGAVRIGRCTSGPCLGGR